ncbi:hypothetical protein AAIA72_11100 [Hahella sp. SMD15-11]|uniref:SbsA Ig-like domain-containing protein n=1 Tax=Thermohahella caldifontis TaxID=3142973 RepID=A0AB39UST6_9GAMM
MILAPEGGLKDGVDYEITINGVSDLAGNVAAFSPLSFRLPSLGDSSVTRRPALALTVYPGFPCETDHSQLDLAAGIAGTCYAKGGANDVLPVPRMPADRPISVMFSKNMDMNSIIPGQTFVVEEVEQASDHSITVLGEVRGRLEKNLRSLRFFPDDPWKVGGHYRYILRSSEDAGTCAPGSYTSICDADGLALKTDLLEGLDDGGANNGPDDMVIYFTGSDPVRTVFTPTRNLPVRDVNANFIVDCDSLGGTDCLEPFDHEGNDTDGWAPSANAAKLQVKDNQATIAGSTVSARVGCKTTESCPRNKFIYQTYALNTEVVGPGVYEPTGEEGILVNLYPTLLAATSVNVFTKVPLLGEQETTTHTQVLRMRYAKDDPNCVGSSCSRTQLVPGVITKGDQGQPVFKTRAELILDAPDMAVPVGGTHDVYGKPFTLELEGDVTFLDDGRMQIVQRNSNLVEIPVRATIVGFLNVDLPLQIPVEGVYLNFISEPVKTFFAGP